MKASAKGKTSIKENHLTLYLGRGKERSEDARKGEKQSALISC